MFISLIGHRPFPSFLIWTLVEKDYEKPSEHQPQLFPMEPQPLQNRDEQFVSPLMGVLANVPTERKARGQVGQSGNILKAQLSRFCPKKAVPLWDYRGLTGIAIVEFTKDCTGFKNALAFESHFEEEGYGKRDWEVGKYRGAELFGWIARAEDYKSHGLIGSI